MSAVYKAIAAVQGELAKVGIAKNRKNTQGTGYNFRGIDDVYSALSPLLAQHGLCVIPRMVERDTIDRASRNGGTLIYTTVKAEFDFVSVEDGSHHTACTYGEAMDSGDKSTNKAMSAAYKYAAFMTFAIPTEGDNDAEGSTHELAPPAEQPRRQRQERQERSDERITDAQRDVLMTLVEQSGADIKRFCNHFGIASLPFMLASQYDEARMMLKKKLEGKGKTKPDPEPVSELIEDEIPY